MDYKNGKIYRIVLDCEDGISKEYIGSTTTTLVKRLSKHRACFKSWKAKNDYNKIYSLNVENFNNNLSIVLILKDFNKNIES
jgi:hypothetical protein